MIIVEVYYVCQPGKRAEVLEYAQPNIIGSRKEPGNISYQHYPDPENEDGVFVFEKWESAELFNNHDKTEHHMKFSALRRPLLMPNSFKITFYNAEPENGPLQERVNKHVKTNLN